MNGNESKCRCRNLADDSMPPSARVGDQEAKRLGLLSTKGCPVHSPVTAPLPPDPADVTDADRAKAEEWARQVWWAGAVGAPVGPAADAIAAALAAERASERERWTTAVESLAEQYRALADGVPNVAAADAYDEAALDLRAVLDCDEQARELLSVVADTTAGEAEGFDLAAACEPVARQPHSVRTLTARSGGAQDDGNARRLAWFTDDELTAELRRRALAGPDDTQQDGAR